MSWLNRNRITKQITPTNYNVESQSFLVVDASASMATPDLLPDRLTAAKEASLGYIKQLHENCSETAVTVISYSAIARAECKYLSVSEQVGQIRQCIKRMRTRSSTDIGQALKKVKSIIGKQSTSASIHIVLLSDGFHNGFVAPVPVANSLKQNRLVRIDCVGVGSLPSSVDERLLKDIASIDENGQPRYHFIKDSLELLTHFKKLAGYLTR